MEQSTISIRIDSQLKKDFEEFCKNVGMNMTTAISIFATTVVNEQRIPFEISADPFYSDIDRNQYKGIGKPERLSGDLSEYWSRRIDQKNRIVYRIFNNNIQIIQCGSHYRDK